MGEVWIIASAHGGEGKTYITAQLGRALARRGKRVALMDLNVGFGELDMALGLENAVVYHLLDAVNGLCRLSQALIRDGRQEGLFLLAAPTNESGALSDDGFERVLSKLKERFDYVLMDAPAGFPEALLVAAGRAHRAIVVCSEGHALRGGRHLVGRLRKEGTRSVGVVCNMSKKRTIDIAQLDADFLGAISRGGATSEIDRLAGVLLCEEDMPKANGFAIGGNIVGRFQRWLDGAGE